jgi:hypothetical protein
VTVWTVLRAIGRHPLRFVFWRWNWKAGLLSAVMRGTIFFFTTLGSGLAVAVRTLLVDATFRIPLAGVCAAVIQEVRCATPGWAALAVALIGVPLVAHAIEITVHSFAGTPWLWRGVAGSIGLSIVSSAVELLLMRHQILLVGPEGGSLGSDLRRLREMFGPRAA